ncbi:VOC family protein [Amphibacillus sediminis]|uniref:VOC family protein n=1 Tax=Amphibacillus sediminis TaxID=360185 RepID=UPI00082FDD4F|nr:glyoxalase/bleomycin resistance/extradiol dioxygenase family protein [Amphibacillus sediminis]
MIKDSMVFLFFNGDCQEALQFYHKVFGAKIVEQLTYGEAEMAETEEQTDLIMNSTIKLGPLTVCASDVITDQHLKQGNQSTIWLEIESEVALKDIYQHFTKQGCQIITELDRTFWNALYAKVQDQFGFTWELNYQFN